MYAIIDTGSKQYRVQEGDEIDVELFDASQGVAFDKVLLVHDGKAARVGAPHVAGCAVHGELISNVKGPKVIAFKYKRCKNYRLKKGHRQKYARVRITKIAVA
jgi:large subunit ribosomal protein L21